MSGSIDRRADQELTAPRLDLEAVVLSVVVCIAVNSQRGRFDGQLWHYFWISRTQEHESL
jgi:hypothetical protein